MNNDFKEKVKCIIPVKVNSYEELFREFDYRDVKERSVDDDLDGWIKEYILRVPYKLRNLNVELIVNMPAKAKDEKNSRGESLLTSLLDSGGTVLLWEVMTLIFIEGKNFKYKIRVNKKLANMDVIFRYIEDM